MTVETAPAVSAPRARSWYRNVALFGVALILFFPIFIAIGMIIGEEYDGLVFPAVVAVITLAVGAVLLLLAGLQAIRRIGQMTHDVQPYAFATFTSAFAMISASYGIWQGWLMCLLGLTPILFAVGARAFETSRPDMVSQTGAPASALG